MKKALKNLLLAMAAVCATSSLVSCKNDVETETEYVYSYSYTDTVYGSISSSNYYYAYSFYGYAGTEYNISANSESSNVYISAGSSTSDYTGYFDDTTYSGTVKPTSDGYVYVRVKSKSSTSASYSLTVKNSKGSVTLSQYDSGYSYDYDYSDSETDSITASSGYIIYSFYAYSSSRYKVEWTNTDSAKMEVSAGDSSSDLTSYFSATSYTGQTFSPSSSGYVYIKVAPYTSSTTGSFTLTVKSTSNSVSLSKYEDNSKSYLYEDSASGTLSTGSDYIIYSFTASSSSSYKVEWTNGSGTSIEVSAGTSSSYPTGYFYSTTTSGKTFTPSSSGTVYIKVTPYSSSYTGSFTLTVKSTSSSVSLTKYEEYSPTYLYNDSVTGNLLSSSDYIIYSFTASSSSSYEVDWTNGSGAKIEVSAGTSSITPTSYFYSTSTSGKTFTPTTSGTVYIKVTPYSSSYTGSFTLTVKSTSSSVSLTKYESNFTTSTASLGSVASTDLTDFTKVYFTASDKGRKYYTLDTTEGTTYTVKWCDTDTSSSFTNTSGYTFIDCKIAVYDGTDSTKLNNTDTNSSFTFTATSSKTIISVERYSSTTATGYCAFYVY